MHGRSIPVRRNGIGLGFTVRWGPLDLGLLGHDVRLVACTKAPISAQSWQGQRVRPTILDADAAHGLGGHVREDAVVLDAGAHDCARTGRRACEPETGDIVRRQDRGGAAPEPAAPAAGRCTIRVHDGDDAVRVAPVVREGARRGRGRARRRGVVRAKVVRAGERGGRGRAGRRRARALERVPQRAGLLRGDVVVGLVVRAPERGLHLVRAVGIDGGIRHRRVPDGHRAQMWG
jgi:hypothetical protein